MRELFTMWQNTRMIVLTAISAAAYVAALLPFKGLVIVPGLTEVRPGAAVPVVLGFLFGPAAAWGAGFGNLIADILGGMLTPGSIFGFLGNALYAYIPYALWRTWFGRSNPLGSGGIGLAVYFLVVFTACLTIGTVIGWGVELLRLAPFAALGTIVSVNNTIAVGVIGTILLKLLFERVKGMNLLYFQILDDAAPKEGQLASRKARVGAILCVVGAFLAFGTGLAISSGLLGVQVGAAGFASAAKGSTAVVGGMLPGLLLLLVGIILL